jgi:DNA-binding MarR family transcriptional regulator
VETGYDRTFFREHCGIAPGHCDKSGHSMTIDLTRDEIWFLKALRVAGDHGRIVSALASHAGLGRLVELQYVTTHRQSERKTLFVITNHGREALANAPDK